MDRNVIQRMTDVLAHRGPDEEGVYLSGGISQNSPVRVALGHRRLKIIDLSSNGHQPMGNEDGSVWIAYNGEIYNFKELRAELEEKKHIFKSNTDTEVIVHLYEELGVDCVKHLRGMFAFAIWDKKKERLFLARDRLGKKPLNYAYKNGSLIFSSEIRPILEDPSISRSVKIESLHNYLSYLYVPCPETMFEGINKLAPAHILVWEKGEIKIEKYWSLSYAKKIKMPQEEYCQKILELFTDAIKARLISDVPLGVFLSGGIDSSAVVALMSKVLNRPVKTFSIGFNEASFNELRYARIVANTFCTEHKEYVVTPKALDILPKLIRHFGEPFADSSSIPEYYLSMLARKDVTVALSGDAGDELFAGYDRYAANKLAGYYSSFPRLFRNRISRFLEKFPESTAKKGIIKRIKRFINASDLPKEKRYAAWVSAFDNVLKEKIYSRQMQERLENIDSCDYILDMYRKSDAVDFIDSTLFVDTMTYLPNDLLVKVDIVSMANSLEVRSPFLDHKLVEFAAQIPSSLKLKGLTTKYILKQALRKLLPREIIQRRKEGFGVPVGRWFQNEIKDYAYNLLLSKPSIGRGYFRPEAIREMFNEHISGKIDHGQRIWILLNLELWHQAFIDK
ncbi:MAG: asparagine synthase (glutamine-hydrolyzing) [Candidatus Omnitrophota bacterium]|nr:asparagine synthase (glutamine-hydrolyzing) [Candidatus Omnitrophota bacterium]